MLRISELELVSHVQAVAVPPLVATQAPLVDAAAKDIIRVNTSSPTLSRNHAPAGNPQTLVQPNEKQTVPARHIDRFG